MYPFRLRILDDDVDMKHIPSAHARDSSEDEDVPVVAAVLDDRPLPVRVAEQYTSSQWKTLGKGEADSRAIKFHSRVPVTILMLTESSR